MACKNMKTIENHTEEDRLLNKHLPPNFHVEVGEDRYCMFISYKEWAQRILDFQVREDDVILAGFPRSGTTWSQEMVWLLVNNLDFNGAKEKQINRAPLLEIDGFHIGDGKGNINAIAFNNMLSYLNEQSSPRCIKTHLPWPLMPNEITTGLKQPKIIYIIRNAKDVCISFYNFYQLFYGFKGSLEDFCLLFLAGRVVGGPFWKSVLSFWKQRHEANILFISYKDMKEDLCAVIKKVANFLEKQLNDGQIEDLMKHLNIENMRNNPAVNRDGAIEKYAKPFKLMVANKNNFIGKGEQNEYLSIMSSELIEKFDKWTLKELRGTDLFVE